MKVCLTRQYTMGLTIVNPDVPTIIIREKTPLENAIILINVLETLHLLSKCFYKSMLHKTKLT